MKKKIMISRRIIEGNGYIVLVGENNLLPAKFYLQQNVFFFSRQCQPPCKRTNV